MPLMTASGSVSSCGMELVASQYIPRVSFCKAFPRLTYFAISFKNDIAFKGVDFSLSLFPLSSEIKDLIVAF